MQKRTVVFLVVLALIVSASLAVAVGPRGHGQGTPPAGAPGGCAMMGAKGGCAMMGGTMAKELGLSDAQIVDVKTLGKECFDATQAARDQIKDKAKAMAALWAVDSPDASQIKAAAAEIDGLKAGTRDTCIDYLIKGLQILTPEQREKLRTMMKDRPGCLMGMDGMGCGMGGGMGQGPGMGCGMGNGTGPRARMGTCPLTK